MFLSFFLFLGVVSFMMLCTVAIFGAQCHGVSMAPMFFSFFFVTQSLVHPSMPTSCSFHQGPSVINDSFYEKKHFRLWVGGVSAILF